MRSRAISPNGVLPIHRKEVKKYDFAFIGLCSIEIKTKSVLITVNNLEKHIKNVHSSAKTSNNASSGIMQQQPQTGQPLVQPQQPQDTQSLDLVALTPGPPQPQVQILQAPQHAPALC